MTLEQLKQRIEATCNKNGIFPISLLVKVCVDNNISCLMNIEPYTCLIQTLQPTADLLLEAVDLECRAIKARQSSATNGIDE